MNFNRAMRINKQIIKYGDTPHERDLARMRIRILKNKRKELYMKREALSYGRG